MSKKKGGFSRVIPVKFRVAGNEEMIVRQRFHSKYIADDGSLTDGLLAVAQAAHAQLRLMEALLKINNATTTEDEEELRGLDDCDRLHSKRVIKLKKTIRSFETGEFSLQCEDILCPRYTKDGVNCPYKLNIAETRVALPEVTNCANRRTETQTSVSIISRDDSRMRRRSDIFLRKKHA
ncbi:MAG: hypothetical protein HZB09_02560 [Candidatus Yonathbacteria bacterium]|nr:hypothetical protein [Candidatus Yonathbacteria bacterium]